MRAFSEAFPTLFQIPKALAEGEDNAVARTLQQLDCSRHPLRPTDSHFNQNWLRAFAESPQVALSEVEDIVILGCIANVRLSHRTEARDFVYDEWMGSNDILEREATLLADCIDGIRKNWGSASRESDHSSEWSGATNPIFVQMAQEAAEGLDGMDWPYVCGERGVKGLRGMVQACRRLPNVDNDSERTSVAWSLLEGSKELIGFFEGSYAATVLGKSISGVGAMELPIRLAAFQQAILAWQVQFYVLRQLSPFLSEDWPGREDGLAWATNTLPYLVKSEDGEPDEVRLLMSGLALLKLFAWLSTDWSRSEAIEAAGGLDHAPDQY